MSVTINHIDPSNLQSFLDIGQSIRNGSQKIEVPWKDDDSLKDFCQDEDQILILKGELENSCGRLIAYVRGETGFIGWYECDDEPELAKALLNEAESWLRDQGCTKILGPINGSTWNYYRFNLGRSVPLYAGEPVQPLYYVQQWADAGFEAEIRYSTEIAPKDIFKPTTEEKVQEMLSPFGLKLHHFPANPDEAFFRKLHHFYNTCFEKNPLFSPISFEDYYRLSQSVYPYMDLNHSLYLTDPNDDPVFTIVSFQDLYHQQYLTGNFKNEEYAENRLMIKTIATREDLRGKQIGTLMVNLVHCLAHEHNFSDIYHLLMYESNLSSTKGQEKFKTITASEYAVMQKTL